MSIKTLIPKFINFTKRQIVQIREGGLTVFRRKVFKVIHDLSLFVFGILILPLMIIVRIIKPFIHIRFGPLNSSRIGHFAVNTEIYLCERDNGRFSRKTLDIFYFTPLICNQQLKKMWKRTPKLHIFQPAYLAHLCISKLPGGEQHVIDILSNDKTRDSGVIIDTSPHLFFTSQEEDYGKAILSKMGIHKDAQFVCIHARDSAYLRSIDKNFDASYHDYRDFSIFNMVSAAEELTRRGYYVIRMGKVVEEDLKLDNPMIIDYATNCNSNDIMDIYLLSKCSFFLTSDAGIYAVAEIFRRPHAFVNFPVLGRAHTWNPQPFIFKKPWSTVDKRFMTLREIFESGVGEFLFTRQYVQYGVDLVENTPEEIKALAIEVDERLKGVWPINDEDEKLQNNFWKIFKQYAPPKLHGIYRTRIGTEFLRQNREWLGLD